MTLRELIKQDRFASPGQEALLNVVVTSNWLMNELATAMAPYDVTPAQYNVLRILRGSHPEKLPCAAIGERLLDRTPDVTRLLNRLQRSGLVTRERAEHDRRVVEVAITDRGLALLDAMSDDVEAAMHRLTHHLGTDEHRRLTELLERLRADQVD